MISTHLSIFNCPPRDGNGGEAPYVEPDFTALAAFFTNMAVMEPSKMWQDVAGTTPVTHGSVVRAIDDYKGGAKLTWQSNDTVRLSYLLPKYGAMRDIQRGLYMHPSGDRPHLFIPNIIDFIIQKSVSSNASPNTQIFVFRNKKAVYDENFTPTEGLNYKQKSSLILSAANSTSGAVDVVGSVHPTEDVWTAVCIVDNGASSRIYFNDVANGNAFTLSAGALTILGLGTSSHVLECDVAFIGQFQGLMSAPNRASVQALLAGIYPIGLKANKPFARNIVITFGAPDTFTITYTYDAGGTGLAEDTALREIEWFCLTPGASPDGWTGLDAVKPVWGHHSMTLVRAQFPTYFPTPGTNDTQIGARVKAYGVGGVSWDGVTLRSNTLNDNEAGTPGTKLPALSTVSIEDGDRNRFILTFTGGSGTINSATGLITDFKAFVDDVEVTITGIAFPGGQVIHIDIAGDIESFNKPRLQMLRGATPLRDSGGNLVEQFVTGPIIFIDNNIIGPVTAKVNLTWSVTTAAAGWVNGEAQSNALETVISNINDIDGNPTGITLAVTDIFQGYSENTVAQTSADIPDGNITKRGFGLWSGGQAQGDVRLSGFTPGKLVDIAAYMQFSNGGNATTSVSFIGATTETFTGINVATLQKRASTVSIAADTSGYITVRLNATSSGETMINAIIFTKYP